MDKRELKRHKRARREARKGFSDRKMGTQVHTDPKRYTRKQKHRKVWE